MDYDMQTLAGALTTLRESCDADDKCTALTYIHGNVKKLESADAIEEHQYQEMCKLVVDTFLNGDGPVHQEASVTLDVILSTCKGHNLNLFETMLQTNRKNRLKIFEFLKTLNDDTVAAAALDSSLLNVLNDCMNTVEPNIMEWTTATACTDNIQMLIEAENRTLSDEQHLEEQMINHALGLLQRLYRIASTTSDAQIERFNTMLMDKAVTLAYMGHKRQRGPALKLLQQAAIGTGLGLYVRNRFPDVWIRYRSALQNTFCKRMTLLVVACEPDWATQWSISIHLLGTDLHRGAGLINNLLSVEEKAFKTTDTVIRRQAFQSWKMLVDNFALDPEELATARRVKLLCIPLNAKNSKTELMAFTKLEVWWHLIIKLYMNLAKFTNPVLTQFLNFCFGPLGETPLLSSKFNVIASQGKRFLKTKTLAIDALMQLLVPSNEECKAIKPILEERLPHAVTQSIFQECYKSFIHSVGEALLVLSQLTDKELEKRDRIADILWTNLLNHIQGTSIESKKADMYKDVLLVVIELGDHAANKIMIADILLSTILPSLYKIPPNVISKDGKLIDLMSKLMTSSVLRKINKNHCDVIRNLLWQVVKPKTTVTYMPNTLEFLQTIMDKLKSVLPDTHNTTGISELWCVIAELATKYMMDAQEINEGDAAKHSFKTIQSIAGFPFTSIWTEDPIQVAKIGNTWKELYKQFDQQADLVATVKPNETLIHTVTMIQDSLCQNKRCVPFAVYCLDALLTSINYKNLLADSGVPSIVHLISDLTVFTLTEAQGQDTEAALRALSSILITVYGHDQQKAVSCLEVTKPAIENMLTQQTDENLLKEIANTWETILSIFRGLGKLLSVKLLSSFRQIITLAAGHSNAEIESQTVGFLEERDNLDLSTRTLLEDLWKELLEAVCKRNRVGKGKKEKDEKSIKQVRMAGSFLNRKTASPKPATSKPKEKDGKNTPSAPEPDSQDYVVIKSDYKFDANRLTEHQKESLKRRRDDIPALYNDLSQSCSQDTQQLQDWFDKKRQADKPGEDQSNKITVESTIDHDANKENKADSGTFDLGISDKLQVAKTDPKSSEEQNIESDNVTDENDRKAGTSATVETNSREKKNEEKENSVMNETGTSVDITPLGNEEFNSSSIKVSIKISDDCEPAESVAKKLDFESLDEFPQNKKDADCSKGEVSKKGHSPKPVSEETTVSENEDSNLTKDSINSSMQKSSSGSSKRGAKRKAASDSESEGSVTSRRQRRRKMLTASENPSDTDSVKSTESEQLGMSSNSRTVSEQEYLSQRTKNEISRLQINMVFESPLPSRRRSNRNEDSADKESGSEMKVSPTGTKLKKSKSTEAKQRENVRLSSDKKRFTRSNEKEEQSKLSKKRGVRGGTARKQRTKDAQESAISDGEKCVTTDTNNDSDSDKPLAFKLQESINQSEELQPGKPREIESSIQQDSEEIIESSQESSGSSTFDNKYGKRKCFIKINKIQDDDSLELVPAAETLKVSKSSKLNDDSTTLESDKDKSKVEDNVTEELPVKIIDVVPMEEVSNLTGTDENTESVEIKSSSPESKKPIEISPTSRCTKTVLNSSSPMSHQKKFSKTKTVAPQGRAAHMLGLVTKQALSECDKQNVNTEELNKKQKLKEADNDTTAVKRFSALKEPEKLGSPSGSRQEKIFNNMKATDSSSSLQPTKLFCKLKNDGEKVSPKLDKGVSTAEVVMQVNEAKETSDGNISPSWEKEDLPILEWSNANPPSLTASPSASILKRRQITLECDPESPSKRKRVSFADPPVSKEMGYEIATAGPPHRMSKLSVSRGLLIRKDSPLKLKQTKLKMIQINPELPENENELQIITCDDTDSQCERQNQLLVNITDDLECSDCIPIEADSDSWSNTNNAKSDPTNATTVTVHDLATEVEIASVSKTKDTKNLTPEIDKSSANDIEMEETETQQDMFDSINTDEESFMETNEKLENSTKEISLQDSTLESLKFNETNDSLTVGNDSVSSISKNDSKLEALEDTADIQNVTGLNSTVNSDEIFYSKPVRTSTQGAEDIAEQDTLPVTSSLFSSMPMSQDSQSATQECLDFVQPELLDSTQPVYPELQDCREPIGSLIGKLANPLWKSHLSIYFSNRGHQTVGDLARLTEREINRIPVKGSPKVEFVRKVLQQFEKTSKFSRTSASVLNKSNAVTPDKSIRSLSASTPLVESLKSTAPIGSLVHCEENEKETKSTQSQTSLEDLLDEIDASLVLKSAVKRCSAENILSNYKEKMKNMSEVDLERETIKMLGIETKTSLSEAHLKTACRACGVNKVLGRLPDIFSHDKDFFIKVLQAYRKKIKVGDCLKGLDIDEVKDALCQICSSSELANMFSKKLKEEEKSGIDEPMTELSSLNAMLKRMPIDLIISHTVANEDLIPASVVLDIALQNNSEDTIVRALDAQTSANKENILHKLCTVGSIVSHIKEKELSEEELMEIYRTVSAKLTAPKLLDAFHETMQDRWQKEHPDT